MGTYTTLLSFVTLSSFLISTSYAQIDLTSANRRPALPGLPDWTQAGFERGEKALPTDADVGTIISAADVQSVWGIIPDDGQDDTEALQTLVSAHSSGGPGAYILIQLPAGVINLSHSVYLDQSYVILRGASNDPDTGTRIVFAPDDNTKYDALNADGSRWDLEGMSFHWEYPDPDRDGCGLGSNCGLIRGTATSGWLWPGRSIFRVSSRRIAAKYKTPYDMAPDNRKDFFLGSVNYHWSLDDGKVKGYQVLQSMNKPGVMGTNRVYVDNSTAFEYYFTSSAVWIGSPVKSNDYHAWGVEHPEYFVNSYVFQDWFTITGRGTDDTGNWIELDHDLRFDVYATSTSDGSDEMEDTITYGKAMPVADIVRNVGIENLYMTQSMPGMSPADAVHNYGNLAPESAMHGIVLRFAQNCWVRNVRTFMTGSHPIATEDAKNIQIQDNYFDGAWNKGAGGNGYLRGSRVWDSLYFNNTLRNLRHITMQWSSMGNVVIMNNITNDMNLHGGYEANNLFELNYVSIPYEHRAGSCTSNCGGEGGSTESGTWFPIYWSTGDKASKWSGASGPQNVFYRNYMLKAMTPGSAQTEFLPYWSRDGSLSNIIWQFGWDRDTPHGDHYQHLTQGPLIGDGVLLDWQGHEQDDFAHDPGFGVNGLLTDKYTSIFLRDVTDASGVPSFSSIAGYAYCRGKVEPKVVGYYMGSSAEGDCLQTDPDTIDASAYTHVLYAYASVGTDGTATITSDQAAQAAIIMGLGNGLKVYLAVGGYGLGADPKPMQNAAVNSGGARTKLGSSLAALCTKYGFDGVDLEWATGITAAQFTTIATTVKTALGTKGVSVTVPRDFWALSGVNKGTAPVILLTETLRSTVDFVNLWTHASIASSLVYPHSVSAITALVQTAQQAGMFPDLLLMPVGFYGRAYQTGGSCDGEGCAVSGPGSTSMCVKAGALGQNTYPYYTLDSINLDGNYDSGDLKADTWTDDEEFYQVMMLSDNSVVFFDVPDSVTYKVGASVDLCMGGVSVFSIEQDTRDAHLESAIWDVGGMAPPAEEIAQAVSGSILADSGDVDSSYFENASSMLANSYPWLPATSVYRVLNFVAIHAQQQIAGRLRNYLQFSDFEADNFALYRKWETKAVDWALANITGYGRQYWVCSSEEGGTYTAGDCPHVFEQNNKDQAYPNVYWKLADHDGFRDLVNETFSLNIDELIVDQIDVSMADIYCINTGGGGLRRKEDGDESDGSIARTPGQIRNLEAEASHDKRQSQFETPDPYDPDPNCKSTWHGVYQANATSMFTNPEDTLNTWIQAYEAAATNLYDASQRKDVTAGGLAALLESILTNIAIGGSSIQNAQSYIDEVRYDKQLQKQFDAYQAQNSGLQMFLDIGLTILSLIPGIGDGAIFAEAIVRVVKTVGDAIKVGRITQGIAASTKLSRALEVGVATEEQAIDVGRSVDALLDAKTLETRGKLAKPMEKNNDVMRQCLLEGFDLLMDANDLAQPLYLPDSAAVARRDWEPAPAPHQNVPHGMDELLSMDHMFSEPETHVARNATETHQLAIRAGGKSVPPCVWTLTTAEALKGFGYEKHCKASTNKMWFNLASDATDDWILDTYANCKGRKADAAHPLFDKSFCACDHLFEALEVVDAMTPQWLKGPANEQRRKDLCAEFPTLTDGIRRALNDANNMEGIWQKSNTMKSYFIDAERLADVHHVELSLLTNADVSKEVEIAVDQMDDYASRRVQVAQSIDIAINAANTARGQAASADWKRLYSPGMMDARRARGDRWYREKLEEATTALVGPNGDTDVHNTAKKRKAPANANPGCKRRRV